MGTINNGAHSVSGFTLIELITVIVILGALTVVVGPRFVSTGAFDERTFYDDVIQAIRYAQAKANGSGCLTQVDFSSSGFTVSVDNDCNSANGITALDIISPDGFTTGYVERVSAPAGMTFTSTVDPLIFDSLGRAQSSATVVVGANTIIVDGATGYVR